MRKVAALTGLLLALAVAAPALARQGPVDSSVPSLPASSPPASGPQEPAVNAASAILVNLQNGRVLYEKSAHAPLAPASLTKVVTALVVRDRFSLDELVTVTDNVLPVRGGKLGLAPGMQMTVRDLLHGLLLLSGNDTAVALAAHSPLGAADFLAAMNAKAKALGATDSTFLNPHGMDEPGHMSSAWDMALFSRRLLEDPVLAEIVATETYPITWSDGSKRVIRNHNKLLGSYDGTIGVKTGFTNKAGRCLINAVQTPAGTALTVVMNSPDHYADTKALVEYYKHGPPAVKAASTRRGRTAPALVLATPKPLRRVATRPAAASTAAGPARVRWMVFPVTLLAASMLLTIRRPRRADPLSEAAQFHAYLEAFAPDTTNGSSPGRAAPPVPIAPPANDERRRLRA